MRAVMAAPIVAAVAQVASAQVPYAPLEPGLGLNSRGGGAAALSVDSTGRWGGALTPTMQRQRSKQIAALRAEAIKRSAANGGVLTEGDRDELRRMAQNVVGVRTMHSFSHAIAR